MPKTKTPPFKLPEDIFLPLKDSTRNRRLAPGAGLSVELVGKNLSHLTFNVIRVFAGNREEPLFECVSAEIGKWWPNSEQVDEVNTELYNSNFDRVVILQEFITKRLHIEVDLDTEGGEAIFRLKFEIEPRDGKSCSVPRSSTISLLRLQSWIKDVE